MHGTQNSPQPEGAGLVVEQVDDPVTSDDVRPLGESPCKPVTERPNDSVHVGKQHALTKI